MNKHVQKEFFRITALLVTILIPGISLANNAICSKPNPVGTILFIHGWNGDAQETWKKFPQLICEDPRFRNVNVVSYSYSTFMFKKNLRINQIAKLIDAALLAEIESPIAIVAHSMGGLVAREISLLHGLQNSDFSIRMLIEIGTPHTGAKHGKLAKALGVSKELTEEVAEDSSYLTSLRQKWNDFKDRPSTKCYSSPQDKIVEEESAFFQCDDFLSYAGRSHKELVKPTDNDDSRYKLPAKELTKVFNAAFLPNNTEPFIFDKVAKFNGSRKDCKNLAEDIIRRKFPGDNPKTGSMIVTKDFGDGNIRVRCEDAKIFSVVVKSTNEEKARTIRSEFVQMMKK